MPNIFEQQARERLGRSLAFLDKSQALLHDDLLYRSALADAVSAIKNMLQGYLLLRIAATPASAVTAQWQEVANTNSMPSLITACIEAGLDLHGLAGEVKRLNAERNYRTHDDPRRLVDAAQAEHALKVARDVQRRIKDAVQGRSASARSLPAAAVERARAASGQLRAAATGTATAMNGRTPAPDEAFGDTAAFAKSGEPLPQSAPTMAASRPLRSSVSAGAAAGRKGSKPAAGDIATTASAADDPEDDSGDSGDSGELAALTPPKRRRPVGRIAARLLAAALLVIFGVAVGMGAVVASTGRAPGWLAFAAPVLPASTPAPAVAAQPSPTATQVTPRGPVTLGTLSIAAPVCSAGAASFALTNTSAQPLAIAAGAASAGTLLTTAAGTAGQPAIFATIHAGGAITLTVLGDGPARVVVTAPAGSVELFAPAC
ncbi:MAG TPA: hypothetical protein VFU88_03890 [Ktedonobacterales bacterium]|nr:hypothetical protein [Ktedonobacterales bacterium]